MHVNLTNRNVYPEDKELGIKRLQPTNIDSSENTQSSLNALQPINPCSSSREQWKNIGLVGRKLWFTDTEKIIISSEHCHN